MKNDCKSDEMKQVHDWWRFFGNLRFSQLGFYGLIAGLLLNALREKSDLNASVGLAGVAVTAVVWVMEIGSTLHGIAWKRHADIDPIAPLFPPFNASNAVLVFYVYAYRFWWDIAKQAFNSSWFCWGFWVLLGWSCISYLPLWVHSARTLKKTSVAYWDILKGGVATLPDRR